MTFLLLFVTGLFAGIVDSIAGGGGLISLPVLLSIGMPPHLAFGTNKLQGTIGTFMAMRKYYQHGLISIASVHKAIFIGVMGACAGAVTSQLVSSEFLRQIIPGLLLIILLYTIFSPKMGHQDEKPKLNELVFYSLFGFSLAFYDGFFGPGTGAFWVFALTYFLGFNLIKATAYTKLFNFNSSFIATICFALGGNVDYRVALCMAAGSLIGNRLGAHLAITKGARLIRPIFVCVVSMTIASLVYKTYSASSLFIYVTEEYGLAPQIAVALSVAIVLLFVYLRVNRRQRA